MDQDPPAERLRDRRPGRPLRPARQRLRPLPGHQLRDRRLGYFDDDHHHPFAGKAALTYFAEAAGTHQLKGGVDVQKTTYDHTKGYTGPGRPRPGG